MIQQKTTNKGGIGSVVWPQWPSYGSRYHAMLIKVTLIGYAGADRQMKFTPAGIPVANFSLAVKEVYKNGDGEKKTNTLYSLCRLAALGRDRWRACEQRQAALC